MFVGLGLENLSPNSLPTGAKTVNISENEFRSLESFCSLPDIEEIIADSNILTEDLGIPYLPKLQVLSLNKNRIGDLDTLLDVLAVNTPSLRILSLVGNPVSPDQIFRHIDRLYRFSQGDVRMDNANYTHEIDEEDVTRYRLRILYLLPQLKFIDSTMVTESERREAERRGEFLKIKRGASKSEPIEPKSTIASSVLPGRIEWLSAIYPAKATLTEDTYTPLDYLPLMEEESRGGRVSYGKSQYAYNGKNSEGNRFIRNYEL